MSGRGIGARVGAEQYGKDVITLSAILAELYKNSSSRPLLVAPGGFFEQKWYAQLLQASGSGVVNVMTHHIYNLGAGMYYVCLLYVVAHVSKFIRVNLFDQINFSMTIQLSFILMVEKEV